jgi:hypothetical protein
MKKILILAGVSTALIACAAQSVAQERQPATFEKLKTLVGDWEGKMEGAPSARVTYRLTSGGSVLVETIMPGEPGEMVTLFHPDGDSVVATHYCGAKNQPRMRAPGGSGEIREIAFKFLDITNLASPEATHMREVTFQFQDAGHFAARWTYRENGKDAPSVFKYTRIK